MPQSFYYRITDGIRVTVRPAFMPGHSRPEQRQFVFSYQVRIENVGVQSAQLLSRQWHIHDSAGEDVEVAGDGVVGLQPVIAPGDVHEYGSFCVLKSVEGWMEGQYHFIREDGAEFDAVIPRFILSADIPAGRGDGG